MDPLEVVGQTVKLRREQVGLTQADLATALAEHGMKVDSTAVVRIERGQRALRIDQLLALAAALDTTPGHLLAPPYGRTLTVGNDQLSAAQVLAWFAGDPGARLRTAKVAFSELQVAANARRMMADVLAGIQLLADAVDRKDSATTMWAATRTHHNLAAMAERAIPKIALERMVSEYDMGGDR